MDGDIMRLSSIHTLYQNQTSVTNIMSEAVRPNITKFQIDKLWTKEHPASKQFWRWLRKFGIDIKSGQIPGFIDGGEGRAYLIGKYVVKFTRDKVGANIANMSTNMQDAPTPVISVWRVPNNDIWAILQHRVYPDKVTPDLKKAADYLTTWLDIHNEVETFPDDRINQERVAKEIIAELNGPKELIDSIISVMKAHNQLYYTTGFSHSDGGPTNISIRSVGDQEELVYHDLGPNRTKGYDPRKILNRVYNNREKLRLPFISEI